MVREAGRIPIIGTLPPLLFSSVASRNATVLSINAEIRAFEDIEVADHYSVLVSEWPENTSGDFIHLGARGNSIVAQEWLRAIEATQAVDAAFLPPIINLLLAD